MIPERIASLLAGGTEIVCGLGLADRLVAISHECDFPVDVLDRPRVTRARIDDRAPSGDIDRQVRDAMADGLPLYEIDADRLAALRPDLVVTQSQCEVCAIDEKDVRAVLASNDAFSDTTLVSLNPTTLDAIFADIIAVGRAADCTAAADEYVVKLRRRVDSVREATRDVADDDRPRVACIEWIDPVMVAANWMPNLIELAGARCDLTRAGDRSAYTSWPDVLADDPDVIIVMPCGFDLSRAIEESATLRCMPGWADLAAVRTGRVFAVDGNAYFNRSGPRIVDSLEILATLIHPDRFDRASLPDRSWSDLS